MGYARHRDLCMASMESIHNHGNACGNVLTGIPLNSVMTWRDDVKKSGAAKVKSTASRFRSLCDSRNICDRCHSTSVALLSASHTSHAYNKSSERERQGHWMQICSYNNTLSRQTLLQQWNHGDKTVFSVSEDLRMTSGGTSPTWWPMQWMCEGVGGCPTALLSCTRSWHLSAYHAKWPTEHLLPATGTRRIRWPCASPSTGAQ